MNDFGDILSINDPKGVLVRLSEFLRLSRQRANLTQPELAKKSGVPKTTISRLEREGRGGTESVFKVLFALGELDGLDEFLRNRLRIVQFPVKLADERTKPAKRVRHPKGDR